MPEDVGFRLGGELPGLYAILDRATLDARAMDLKETVRELAGAGVMLMQYRDKVAAGAEMERRVGMVLEAIGGSGSGCRLILNDNPEMARRTGCDGVHVGQGDVRPEEARAVLGAGAVIGVSTHTRAQVVEAERGAADYVAIGPVFRTGSKVDHEPEVGLPRVRLARSLTRKALVGIGGISLERVAEVLGAGADSVAVIGALYVGGRSVGENARELLQAVSERRQRGWLE